MATVFEFEVSSASATALSEIVGEAVAHVIVSDSFPDPEEAARSYLVKHGYNIEASPEDGHAIDDELLRENYRALHARMVKTGFAVEVFGATP